MTHTPIITQYFLGNSDLELVCIEWKMVYRCLYWPAFFFFFGKRLLSSQNVHKLVFHNILINVIWSQICMLHNR